jgi:hypothetical protein
VIWDFSLRSETMAHQILKVIEFSDDLNDYPFPERLMKIGSERDRIPFVFNRPPLLEEISWSALEGSDFYPTLTTVK